jgi:hypothetical protein
MKILNGQSLLLVTDILHWNSHKIPGTILLLDFNDSVWQQSTQLAFLAVNSISVNTFCKV